jgi:hypothetical protein
METQRRRQRLGVLGAALGGFAIAFLVVSTVRGGPGSQPGTLPRRPVLTAQQRAERFQAGEPWQGRGRGPWSQADVDAFADYALVWLGEEFAGYHLQAVSRTKYDAPPDIPTARPQDMVTFIYGTCTPAPGAHGCLAPASVQIQPACLVRPEQVAERVKHGPAETVRGGGRLQRFADGHVMLWIGKIVVRVNVVADPDRVDDAVRQLRGVGRLNAALRAGGPLASPDFSACPRQ